MSIATIVVPTGFSDHAARAFATALEFAKAFGATVRLIRVYDVPDTDTISEVTFPEGVVDGIRKATKLKLDALKEQAKADLIVMGSRGHGSLNHMLLGNVAERTLRTARCPVLTIGKNAAATD